MQTYLRSSSTGRPGSPATKRRRVSISTIVILVLVAIAALAYYFGTPPPLPTASTSTNCPSEPAEVVIPNGAGTNSTVRYELRTLTLIVGSNNTAVWDDQDTSSTHVVISVSVPPDGSQWNFNPMTAGHTYCVTLDAPGTYTYEMYMPYGIIEGTIVVMPAH